MCSNRCRGHSLSHNICLIKEALHGHAHSSRNFPTCGVINKKGLGINLKKKREGKRKKESFGSMPRVLLVAEKPSIAKAVAQHLSGNQLTVHNTTNKYVKNYDFTFRFPPSLGGECNATMTSVIGHVMHHDFEQGTRKWNSCPPAQLFDSQTVASVSEVCTQS